ncbi:hypothetical protein FQN50_004490 [Emmonsiellopsis sp. PD_5]|nr:hypothetical protein FQN50_004490 [Emmonsiellopsis sp. PD_5]
MSLPDLLTTISTYTTNLTTNLSTSVSSLTLRDYIRLIWIIGGYLFLRPYLDAGFRKLLTFNMDKSDKEQEERERTEAEAAGVHGAKVAANKLRGAVEGESDEEEEEEEVEGEVQWGKSARRRQKQFLRHLEEEAERRKEEEDDRDIADLLED